MSYRHEEKWIREALGEMDWPSPSAGLHGRIMAAISVPESPSYIAPGILPFLPARAAAGLSLGLLTAFIIAFGLGMAQERPSLSPYADVYASPFYYGEIDSRFDRPQEF